MISNIYMYKIGFKNYEGVQDKNSGSYEYEKIIDEICDMCLCEKGRDYCIQRLNNGNVYESKNDNALIVVGGKPRDFLDESLKYMIKEHFKLSIFIATDIDCLEMNREIIDQCDYLLHQSPICLGYKDRQHEMYNWIPEIFFNPNEECEVPEEFKNKCVLFAGSLDGREKKVMDFFKNDRECVLIPKNKSWDLRLEYREYKKLLPLFQNTYVTACEEALNIGWVTSRFVEAISCNVIPLVDVWYDKFGHFGGIKEPIEGKECTAVDMDICKTCLKYHRNEFKNLIKDLLTEE